MGNNSEGRGGQGAGQIVRERQGQGVGQGDTEREKGDREAG